MGGLKAGVVGRWDGGGVNDIRMCAMSVIRCLGGVLLYMRRWMRLTDVLFNTVNITTSYLDRELYPADAAYSD